MTGGDLRKPFYDYAIERMKREEGPLRPPAMVAMDFAEWAFDYMSDATPARALEAWVAARR